MDLASLIDTLAGMPLVSLFRFFACLVCVSAFLCSAERTVPSAVDLSQLPPHPRLIARAADWESLEQRRKLDPLLEAYVQDLIVFARHELKHSKMERTLQGRRLLFVSRDLIQSSLLCSFAYRVTGERVFFEKARAELLEVCAFEDWNPSHFLDVAEMAAGVAISYDWLYDLWSAEDRAVIKRALVEKALKHGEKGNPTFIKENNWAQVCGGGLSLAALALGDEEPALASAVLGYVKAGLKYPLSAYAPDGCYPEGASYWSYGTMYHIILVSALRSALGDDWDILKSPGFLRSAEFEAQCSGPKGLLFNFADSGKRDGINEALCYMARELKRPALAWNTRDLLKSRNTDGADRPERFAPLLAFWWPFGPEAAKAAEPDLFFTGRGTNAVAIWRSAWTDTKARYFAIKAGGSGVSHGHMDGGTFVLDWKGKRWASDLGMQDYNSLESRGIKLWDMGQDSPRWGVFRLSSSAHNTLTLDGARHEAKGLAKLLHADKQGAEIDLTPILHLPATGVVLRKVAIEPRRIVITDELSGLPPGQSLRWAMTSTARIQLETARAVLTQDAQTLPLLFEGSAVELSIEDISTPRADFDAPNPGMRQLVARFKTDAQGRALLRVCIEATE